MSHEITDLSGETLERVAGALYGMVDMLRTRITSKGQVIVPIEVRRQLDLQLGDELVFEIRDQELFVRGLKRRKLSDLRGSLEATAPFPDVTRSERR